MMGTQKKYLFDLREREIIHTNILVYALRLHNLSMERN